MPVSSRSKRDDLSDDTPTSPIRVAAYESCPGRHVFIEDGNTDAWISTDYTVAIPR